MATKDTENLKNIMNIKTKEQLKDNTFCWLYPFTNENISAYYSKIDFKDKKILTVTSSGDHIFNAFLLGASEVDAFDSNPLSKCYVELKKIGIEKLTYEEFLLFFYNKNIIKKSKYFLDYNIYYTKLRSHLKDIEKYFWDYLFEKYTKEEIINSPLFTDDYLSLSKLVKVNDYLKEENYYKLKDIIKGKDINYHTTKVEHLANLNKKYDIIILSNIPAFFDIKDIELKLEELKKTLSAITNEDSRIILCYLYGNSMNSYAYEGIYDKELIKKSFPNAEYMYFKSSDTINYPKIYDLMYSKKDSVIITDNKIIKK